MRKKIKKLSEKRPKVPAKLRRKKKQFIDDPDRPLPRITNQTVAEHREEVIGSARKFIYPLQHSKHRIVLMSTGLFIVTLIIFVSYSVLALYKFQGTSTFLYRTTQVIPFPIARACGRFVTYENYLFELRHYTHYYENQLNTDFGDPQYAPQLADFKKRALDKVVNDACVKELAKRNNVSVGGQEIDDQIGIVRNQNRLGGNDEVFEDVLKDYWGWSVGDFKRSLGQEILAQKVAANLDTETTSQAKAALAELQSGAKFGAVAKKYSDDASTKNNGGKFGYAVERTDRNLSAKTTDTLFELKTGQTSDIVNIGYALEILKNLKIEGDTIRGAHILFNFNDISTYIDELKEGHPVRLYLSLPNSQSGSNGN